MLTENDIPHIEANKLTVDAIFKQLEKFTTGIPYANVVTSASVGNGIEVISETDREKYISLYDSEKKDLEIVKFVPASGAATRMFKFLHEFLEQYDPNTSITRYMSEGDKRELVKFFQNYKEFPFLNQVRNKIRENYPDYKQSTKGERFYMFVSSMLEENGLNFGNIPKGLIPFHKYTKYATTAFEEQLFEAAHYASARSEVYLHFTFSEAHVTYFKEKFEEVKKRITKKTKTQFHISYSFQKKETDTIAVTLANEPYRDIDNKLVFRPSGHGALLENLNDVDADVIFIKNIDNVAAQDYIDVISLHKKVLAGKLLWLQKQMFQFLERLENETYTDELYKEVKTFLWKHLYCKETLDSKDSLIHLLDRPIRVCGVVKNTGAPGGGPFWVKTEEGTTTLQIVEMAQINPNDRHQVALSKESTHFNPVDIVCGVRDYKGRKYDLTKFRNPRAGFISKKSLSGTTIKALELPGLWNGSMAKWNTVFVEVPAITFNPVKTVNDLLEKEHRPNA